MFDDCKWLNMVINHVKSTFADDFSPGLTPGSPALMVHLGADHKGPSGGQRPLSRPETLSFTTEMAELCGGATIVMGVPQ